MVLLRLPDCSGVDFLHRIWTNAHKCGDLFTFHPPNSHAPNLLCLLSRKLVAASITGLSALWYPRAVVFEITQVVVATLKSKSFRLWRHISDEVANVMPSRTYQNASASVTEIRRILGVIATVHHALPRLIERVPLATVPVMRVVLTYKNVLGMFLNAQRVSMLAPSRPMSAAPSAPASWFPTSLDRAFFSHRAT